MLLGNLWHFLRSQHPQVVANEFSCVLRINDIIDKATLGGNHRIGKTRSVFGRVFFNVLSVIEDLHSTLKSYEE